MTTDAREVTLAILNYNGRRHLEMMLPSVFAQTAQGFAVHVVDDASTDDSLEYLAREWPQVRVLPSERNLNITASMSRAVETAHTPYVAVLNNDLELHPRWLEELLGALRARPRTAAVDCKLLAFADRTLVDGVGDEYHRNAHPRRRGQLERDAGQYDEPAEVFSVSGAAALYRRAAFDDVGLYDGDLVAYYEDVDWGFRARLRGWDFWTAPSAVAYHVGSATTSSTDGRFYDLIVRNALLVAIKDIPGRLLLAMAPRILWHQLKWLVDDTLRGLGPPHVRGLYGVLRALPRTLRKRAEVQRTRTVPVRDLRRVMGDGF